MTCVPDTPASVRSTTRHRAWRRLLGPAMLAALCAAADAREGPPASPDRGADWALALAGDDPERAWALFAALTAPAEDAPDPDIDPGPGAMAWETWRSSTRAFPPRGARPAPWGADEAAPDPASDGLRLSDGVHLFSSLEPSFVTGGLRDRLGRPIYSEVRLNRVAFEHMVAEGLFSLDGQIAFARAGRDLEMPDGAMEVKATWRVLDGAVDPALAGTYLTTTATRPGDDAPVTLGLTSLNVLAKRGGAWFATAFEHEANPTETLNDRSPHVALVLRRPADYEAANAEMRARHAGTPAAHYVANGGQAGFAAEDGGPVFLTNTQQETDILRSSSCLSCHAHTALGLVEGVPTRLSPLASQNPDGTATGFLGAPDPAVLDRFTTFDMMWSVLEASAADPDLRVRMIGVGELPPAP